MVVASNGVALENGVGKCWALRAIRVLRRCLLDIRDKLDDSARPVDS